MTILEQVRARAIIIWDEAGIMDESVEVTAAPLTVEQAIGKPEGQDFPIQKGKEKLMEASFKGAKGQAFTDTYGDYRGSLRDIASLDLAKPMSQAIFVATLNAVMRCVGQTECTIHCKDAGPAECSKLIAGHIRAAHGQPRHERLALVGQVEIACRGVPLGHVVSIDDVAHTPMLHRRIPRQALLREW